MDGKIGYDKEGVMNDLKLTGSVLKQEYHAKLLERVHLSHGRTE